MKILKVIEIDLDAERKRIETVDYSQEEKEKLFELVNLFELGAFDHCIELISSWTYMEKTYINTQIYGILWDIGVREQRYLTEQDILDKYVQV